MNPDILATQAQLTADAAAIHAGLNQYREAVAGVNAAIASLQEALATPHEALVAALGVHFAALESLRQVCADVRLREVHTEHQRHMPNPHDH